MGPEKMKQRASKNSLTEAIQKWLDETGEDRDWVYIPEDAAKLIADAGFAVMMGFKGVENYFRSQNMIKED